MAKNTKKVGRPNLHLGKRLAFMCDQQLYEALKSDKEKLEQAAGWGSSWCEYLRRIARNYLEQQQ